MPMGCWVRDGRCRALETGAQIDRVFALLGPDPSTLVGPGPHEALLDSVMSDLRWIVDGAIIESPVYGVLRPP